MSIDKIEFDAAAQTRFEIETKTIHWTLANSSGRGIWVSFIFP